MAHEPAFSIPKGLEDDPDILAAAKPLILAGMRAAIEVLEEAPLNLKMSLVRSILPAALKSISAKGNEDELTELRVMVSRLYAEIGGDSDADEPE